MESAKVCHFTSSLSNGKVCIVGIYRNYHRKKGRERPRGGYVKALSKWANVEAEELMNTTIRRVEWRAMTANALKEHGT